MRGRRRRAARVAGLAVLVLATAGCVRGCKSPRPPIHINPNMDDQPKLKTQAASGFFYDGRGMRLPVPGTVARGELHEDAALQTGKDAAGAFLTEIPLTVDDHLLARGAERYSIYCQPCHDKRGTGQGILFTYGKVPTANLLDEQRRALSVGQIYDAIVNGKGLMQGYRYPVPPADRWAIVAHVLELQREDDVARARMQAEEGR